MRNAEVMYNKILRGEETYTSLGRRHNVSDNTIRKQIKKAGYLLPKKLRGRQEYCCSYCNRKFTDDISRELSSKTGTFFCGLSCKSLYQKINKNEYF